ncbi:hypothetical protein [Erythrobacter mangrovi]|uniref:Ferric reductase like transmembrane component n=1 Tax=Erythrobacter mangrovi TaxID=2739433 RepID=A0A7D4BPN6_9SPHN|nr:hypothetical protein [Erythrobacter mangrovi]QKG72144.1 hypothetical protein HQR01_12635 [Erythrobacter mangrovi]
MASQFTESDESTGFATAERRRSAEHESFLSHRRFFWARVSGGLALFVLLTYLLIDVEPRHNGGSWYGYTLGTIGLGLIVWLAWLGVRKRRPTPGSWSLKGWTSAHVWLGLSLVVIGTLHTGFQLGWNVHTLAWALMMLVIITGIYGISVYAVLPARLSENRREMTREQMVESLAMIDRQLEAAAQPLSREDTDYVIAALEQDVFSTGLWGRLRGPDRHDATRRALDQISTDRAYDQDEDDLAQQKVRGLLGRRASQIDQIRRQMRTKALLEIWLFAHVPLTIALLAALTAHVISVFFYW